MHVLGTAAAGAGDKWWWPLLVGAVLTLVAGLIGKAFEASRADSGWRRDQKLRCFAALLDESHTAGRLVEVLATEVARTRAESPSLGPKLTAAEVEASRNANAAVAQVDSRVAEVKLLGCKETCIRAERLGKCLHGASGAFHCVDWLGEQDVREIPRAFDSHERVVAVNIALDRFTEAARNDISS